MRVLEPTLIKSTTDVSTGITGAEVEIDFDFAALEGALIIGVQFAFFLDVIDTDVEADNFYGAALNYNPSFISTTVQQIFEDDFTFAFYAGVVQAVGTPASTYFLPLVSERFDFSDEGGLPIVRNISQTVWADSGSPTFGSKIWYKRVIFDERELVPFVALRR